MSERLEIAERLSKLRSDWFRLTRELGASTDGGEDDRLIRELESIESEVRTAVVDAAKIMQSDEKEIATLRLRAAEYRLAHEGSEAVICMAVARIGGLVEGRPTHRGNFLQRIDELVRIEDASDLLNATMLFADVVKCRKEGPWRDVDGFRKRWNIPNGETVEAFCERVIALALGNTEPRP